jgi:hypothetical protein
MQNGRDLGKHPKMKVYRFWNNLIQIEQTGGHLAGELILIIMI